MSKRTPRIARGRVKPQSAAAILAKSLHARHLDKKIEQYSAFPLWPEIAGAAVAQVAVPEKIMRGKILVVRVIDSTWAQELSMQKVDLMDKIHAAGMTAIEDIRFITGSPTSISGRTGTGGTSTDGDQ